MTKLDNYGEFVGDDYIRALYELGSSLDGKAMAHVNSTYYGGGVAEMLNSYVPLLNEAGLSTEWRLLKGSREFFAVTKGLHNSLQGMNVPLSKQDIACYEENLDRFVEFTKLDWYDLVVIDDPQPCGLITRYDRKSPSYFKSLPQLLNLVEIQRRQPWVWRCHIDISRPNPKSWDFMRRYVDKYDAIIVSSKEYATPVRKPHHYMTPAIDPLSNKNRKLSDAEISREISKYDIDANLPMVLQVSRFDTWKDPLGVIEMYRRVKRKVDCQLVLIGSMASDDPEGEKLFNEAFRAAERERHVHLITAQNDVLVNALQRSADVVVQKSLREGFGLTVSEAMWKGTPVVASRVGGIPLQVDDGVNGYLVDGVSECAQRVSHLLTHPVEAREMGQSGIEKVRRNFLMPRLVRDEMALFAHMTAGLTERVVERQRSRLLRGLDAIRKLVPKGSLLARRPAG